MTAYTLNAATCSACTLDPFEPVKATCFGVNDVVNLSTQVDEEEELGGHPHDDLPADNEGWTERIKTRVLDSGLLGKADPAYACDACCDHKGTCAPAGKATTCDVCKQDTALWGASYCYGCKSHVCKACLDKAPSLPDTHDRMAHPT